MFLIDFCSLRLPIGGVWTSTIWSFIPLDGAPFEGIVDILLIFGAAARLIGVFNSQDKFTTENGTDEALCVVVRLKPERFYIPDAQQPIRKNKSMGTRENLAGLLKPVPEGEEIDFDIRETPWIRLGPNIIAVINTGWTDQHQKHINSPLVDPGFDWPIRTEGLHGLDYVEFFLYEK